MMHWRMDTVLHKRGYAMTTTACKGPDDQLECVLVGEHARLRAAGCGCLGSLLGAGSSTLSGGTPATGTDTLQSLLSPCTSLHRKGMRHGGICSCWHRPRAPLTDLCGVSARGRLDSSRYTPWRHAGDAPRRGHGARGSGVYERHARQRTAVCLVDGEPIPLRASFAAMAAETRRDRRAAIEAAVRLALREINALFESHFTAQHTLVEPLGYASPEALWADILPTAPATLQDVATQLLASTEEVYRDLLTWAVRRRLDLPPGQLRRHDMLALFTFPDYQAYYQPGTVVPGLQRCLREMGLAPEVGGRLAWRERAAHFGPPAALALHIPDDIVLSYAPVQGLQGAEA